MTDFRMPSLGADMEDGKLVEWLKHPGDALKRGDILAVVETQKGAIEIEVFEDGVLEESLIAPGAVLPVGAVMARIRGSGMSAAAPHPAPSAPVPAAMAPTPPPPAPATSMRTTPAARRLAAERAIDLSKVLGTGPGGSITREDVESLVATTAPAPSSMRQAIAAAMARSKREIPHYYLAHTIDVSAAQTWLSQQNALRAPAERLLLGALQVKATALALREFPDFNGFFDKDAFQPSADIHVGVAIAIRGGGLAAPAIHNAADLTIDDLMAKTRDLVRRVRAGRFRSSEIADPTITVTSLGDRGVESVWGVIYPPQVAIVGFGKAIEKPWIVAGEIKPRPAVTISLAGDHRVSDGHAGALFLQRIGELLSAPAAL
ncbi:MAG: 2-oxo acid dehydrogenase subunit E2 [Hyphomonadaceae bacterium]|nr:2-oxo acid dehydrogenase subunit E2 [Hyphomonadaceae bacterium]